jgi:hypothetical protein
MPLDSATDSEINRLICLMYFLILNSAIFWDMTQCNMVEVCQRFGGIHFFQLQD